MSSRNGVSEEWLLGFDAREPWPDVGREWDASRRERYLLREDVSRPLSVDTSVWPSVFAERSGLHTASPPDWRGPNAPLWDDLSRMRGGLSTLGAGREVPHTLIAVSCFWNGQPAKGSWLGAPYCEPTVPAARDEGWRFLGFDVADGGFISGLTNCGYTDDEIAALRQRWAGHLNEHHLFDDEEQALAFRELSDRRVPEHAPFFVFGLFEFRPLG